MCIKVKLILAVLTVTSAAAPYQHKPLHKRLVYGYPTSTSDSNKYMNLEHPSLHSDVQQHSDSVSSYLELLRELSRPREAPALWNMISERPRYQVVKRENEEQNDSNNMWFGPRLGRSVGLNYYDNEHILEQYKDLSRLADNNSSRKKRNTK